MRTTGPTDSPIPAWPARGRTRATALRAPQVTHSPTPCHVHPVSYSVGSAPARAAPSSGQLVALHIPALRAYKGCPSSGRWTVGVVSWGDTSMEVSSHQPLSPCLSGALFPLSFFPSSSPGAHPIPGNSATPEVLQKWGGMLVSLPKGFLLPHNLYNTKCTVSFCNSSHPLLRQRGSQEPGGPL